MSKQYRAAATGTGWKVERHDGCEKCGRYHTILYIYPAMHLENQEVLAQMIADLLNNQR